MSSLFSPSFQNDPTIHQDPTMSIPLNEGAMGMDDMPPMPPDIESFLEQQEQEEQRSFHENVADFMPESELSKMAGEILDGVQEDKDSAKEWEQDYLEGMKYLGLKLEDADNLPFTSGCRAFDCTMTIAWLTFYSVARTELFPAKGPAKVELDGLPTAEDEDKAQRIKDWMNCYLTVIDKDYYPDSQKMLAYLGLVGCVFRKAYYDPLLKRPVLRFIKPQDLIINNHCMSLLSSDRITHVLHYTRRDIALRQKMGIYRDVNLSLSNNEEQQPSDAQDLIMNQEGINVKGQDNKYLFDQYESHVNYDLSEYDPFVDMETEIPVPYIVTIDVTSRKVLSIYRNWEENDDTYARKECFTQYDYVPGFGLRGIGLARLLGSNSVLLTSLTRQLIDAGTYKNFPGGLKVKGLPIENNNKAIGPGEFLDIDTAGLPIQQAIMTMPYDEPSLVLRELRNDLNLQTQKLASVAETQIAEDKRDMPVGTTLALLEANSRIQSVVMKSLHMSMMYELQLLFKLFGEYLPDEPYPFAVPGKQAVIMRQDFTPNVRVIPVSDPSLSTSTQRLVRGDFIIKMMGMAPDLHDRRAVFHRAYEAAGIENIDQILPPPQETQPLDPINENMNLMQSKPVKAALWQDHESHMATHAMLAQQGNQQASAHIQEHQAMKYYLDMQMAMGMQMPPLEQAQDPQIQNDIALKAAQVARQQQQQQAQQQPIDPNAVMMADIAQRRDAAELKAQTEAFKSQLKFEGDKSKMETQKDIAEEKNQTDLEIQHLKTQEKERQHHEYYEG